MSKKWLVSMLGAGAMAVSGGVLAQGFGSATSMATVPNFYVGIDVGQTDIDTVEDDDIGFKILGGYQFHRNIAAEIGYGMLFDKSGVEVTSLEAAAVFMFPVANQISIIGKLGFARLEADPGDTDNDFLFGIGAQFDATRNLGVRVQWMRYNTDPEVDFLSAGVIWRF